MGLRQSLAALGIALLMISTAAGSDSESVGTLGRPSNLLIEGAKSFSPDQIREALFNELAVVSACEPDAALTKLTMVITNKVTSGYLGAGFADVAVSVAAADGKLVMAIKEGERFSNGEIEVSGNRQVDADTIKAQLAQPQTTGLKPHPAWRPNETASFGPEAEARLALNALAAVGTFRPPGLPNNRSWGRGL